MSNHVEKSSIDSCLSFLWGPSTVQSTQTSIIPANITQAIFVQPVSFHHNSVASIGESSKSSEITQSVAKNILSKTREKRPLQEVLSEWAGEDASKISAISKIISCINEKSKILDLSFSNLLSLPDVFDYPEFNKIESLILTDNLLAELPESISQLENLTNLNAGNNVLTELPKFMVKHKSISTLIFNNNFILEIPKFIVKIPKLRHLNLADNQLTTIPIFIEELKCLRILILNGNQITTIPLKEISQMQYLQHIDLGNTRMIDVFSPIFL